MIYEYLDRMDKNDKNRMHYDQLKYQVPILRILVIEGRLYYKK